ncbi:hypothetical protein [Pseudomonas agarici]|uniref:hypothetical protein n=1 Tax=Pseudomonas agarici TaxID=46677 RepID=UPI000A5B717A|nr:hypothetical protein [Pseudomonas agarici]
MSKLTFNIGYAIGIVTREFLRAVNTKDAWATPPTTPTKVAPQVQLPPPCVPDNVLRDMDRQPAMVRAYGTDLNHWYEANTRMVQKPARKRRSRTTDTDQANIAPVGSLTPGAC